MVSGAKIVSGQEDDVLPPDLSIGQSYTASICTGCFWVQLEGTETGFISTCITLVIYKIKRILPQINNNNSNNVNENNNNYHTMIMIIVNNNNSIIIIIIIIIII